MSRSVLIVDDHPSFRASARLLLESEGWEVVGEAADGAEALARARELKPDLVLLDVALPDIDGFEVTARLNSNGTPAKVILVSSRDCDDYGRQAQQSGALGFISKGDLSGEAVEALL